MSATLNQTACQIREVVYVLPAMPCDRCQQPAHRVTTAHRVPSILTSTNRPWCS